MNAAQRLVFWLEEHSRMLELIETRRADWFGDQFPVKDWMAGKTCVLDLGSGIGDITRKIQATTNGLVVGVDRTHYRRKGTRSASKICFVLGEGGMLPFREEVFDCVTVFWVLHHVEEPLHLFIKPIEFFKSGAH